ncbi:MAG: gfo/Idh/MocA family oxidoreductase [Planctomycetia bacterium]|nr:gfo/Idh/MocA family oxidoreductase [Planctomycetia bacterium]
MTRSVQRSVPSSLMPRRDFLHVAAGAVAATAAMPTARAGHAGTIRLGLIGCGGRGTGAATQAALADPEVEIVAIGDAFADHASSAADHLARDVGERFACPPQRRFSGPDAFRRVLDAGVDAVVIAAPPHLRPQHVNAAVAAGCHVFCETPAATDVAGVLEIEMAFARARVAGLSVASGLHARRDAEVIAAIDGVHAGSIGRPLRVEVSAARGAPWRVPTRPGWTAAEARLRNWITDDALSGGPFVERSVHAIDRALWVLGDRAPEFAEPLAGGRAQSGAVRYRFTDGAEIVAVPRIDDGVHGETVTGTRGGCGLRLSGDGRRFQATMTQFIAGIRCGRGLDEAGILVRGTLAAIMGRRVSVSRRPLAWAELAAADAPASPALQIDGGVNLGDV